MLTISKDFTFEASHVLPKHPGQCSRLHGHSWKLTVEVRGEPDPETGFVMDYGDLKKIINDEIISKVDHQHLGCGNVTMGSFGYPQLTLAVYGPDFYPSSENLVRLFADRLNRLPVFREESLKLSSLTLHETCTSAATWRVDD